MNKKDIKRIEYLSRHLSRADLKIKKRKCLLYGVLDVSECNYSALDDAKKEEADFLDLIEEDVSNALDCLRGIY